VSREIRHAALRRNDAVTRFQFDQIRTICVRRRVQVAVASQAVEGSEVGLRADVEDHLDAFDFRQVLFSTRTSVTVLDSL
jgi:hypothetical protein